MSPPPPEEEKPPLQVLLERVERDREERCREILQAARSEAAAIRQEAYSRARRRLHQTIRNERQRVQQRLGSAQAERATRLRQRRHKRINAALETAWSQLEEALQRRWADPEGRRQWLRGALEQAGRFLPAGRWTLVHPPKLDPGELPGDPAAIAGSEGITLAPEADPDLEVGIRIRCGEAELDATPAGLLVDRERVRSWLLAAIQRQGGEDEP